MLPSLSTDQSPAGPALAALDLPRRDVRRALDESVFRGWTEMSRRLARVSLLLLFDTIAGLAGVFTCLRTWVIVSNDGVRPLPLAIPLVAMVLCIQPLALKVTGAYGGGKARRSLERIAAGILITAIVGWIQARLFGQMTPDLPNKTAYLYSAAIITVYVWVFRQILQGLIQAGLKHGILQRRALVIGGIDEIRELGERARTADITIVSGISPSDALTPNAIHAAVRAAGAQMVLIAPSIPYDAFRRMVFDCLRCGVGVSLLPRALGSLGASYFELRETSVGVLLQVFPLRLGLPQLALKRSLDIVVTLGVLTVLWPVFAIIAIAIKLNSAGPVLFRQIRAGVGGTRFEILKFRTMRVGADAEKNALLHLNEYPDPRLFKIKADPRVTSLGGLLRRYSLDELPQLWNVLRGDMSLVGPRPFFPGDMDTYERHHFERLQVLPGITGLWQVSGRSDVVDFDEVVRLDREYIRNWSLTSDIVILLRTIPAAFGRGAY